jgi:ABC-type multidrug transport system ATPase subunit
MLELKSISKKFNSYIFEDFSYIFKESNIYFLKGNNGSGKTTLLKLIKGIYQCDCGKISLNGLNQKDDIVFIDSNSRSFFHRLTVDQNLKYFYSIQNKKNNEYYPDNLLELFNIKNLKNKKFSMLSQGQMQMISLVRGLLSGAKIILLDEVFSSLDERNKKKLFNYLSTIILEKKALIIFTSHERSHGNMDIKEICLD